MLYDSKMKRINLFVPQELTEKAKQKALETWGDVSAASNVSGIIRRLLEEFVNGEPVKATIEPIVTQEPTEPMEPTEPVTESTETTQEPQEETETTNEEVVIFSGF